jgi:hypothetical protein
VVQEGTAVQVNTAGGNVCLRDKTKTDRMGAGLAWPGLDGIKTAEQGGAGGTEDRCRMSFLGGQEPPGLRSHGGLSWRLLRSTV